MCCESVGFNIDDTKLEMRPVFIAVHDTEISNAGVKLHRLLSKLLFIDFCLWRRMKRLNALVCRVEIARQTTHEMFVRSRGFHVVIRRYTGYLDNGCQRIENLCRHNKYDKHDKRNVPTNVVVKYPVKGDRRSCKTDDIIIICSQKI